MKAPARTLVHWVELAMMGDATQRPGPWVLPPGRAARSTTWACTCKSFINGYCFLSSAFQGTSPSDLKLFFSYQINGYIS